MEKIRIKFSDLSGWLKTAFIFTCIMAGIVCLAFLVGFIQSILGVQ